MMRDENPPEMPMGDRKKLDLLERRLRCIESESVSEWHRSILEVGRQAIEAELTEIGRRLVRRNYWRQSRTHPAAA